MTATETIKALTIISGGGKSLGTDLCNIGIRHIDNFKCKDLHQLKTLHLKYTRALQRGEQANIAKEMTRLFFMKITVAYYRLRI